MSLLLISNVIKETKICDRKKIFMKVGKLVEGDGTVV